MFLTEMANESAFGCTYMLDEQAKAWIPVCSSPQCLLALASSSRQWVATGVQGSLQGNQSEWNIYVFDFERKVSVWTTAGQ